MADSSTQSTPGAPATEQSSSGSEVLAAIPLVEIEEGTFKYVLISVTDTKLQQSKFIVRGYNFAEYHDDVYRKAKGDILKEGIEMDVKGGGRIKHELNADGKGGSVLVYGYSVAFGQADHKVAVELIKAKYPQHEVTFSNEGY